MLPKIKLVDPTPDNLAQQVRDIAATPNMEALEKLPSDTERERHWLIGVMGMLGASFRGEYEDVTEALR